MSNLIKKDGYNFAFDSSACSSCPGNCCIGESGYIWISENEILNLAKYLKISQNEVREKYLYKASYKYSIKEIQLDENNFSCCFFNVEKKQCMIYEVRPMQCRTFPFWEYFKENIDEVVTECPGIIRL